MRGQAVPATPVLVVLLTMGLEVPLTAALVAPVMRHRADPPTVALGVRAIRVQAGAANLVPRFAGNRDGFCHNHPKRAPAEKAGQSGMPSPQNIWRAQNELRLKALISLYGGYLHILHALTWTPKQPTLEPSCD